MDNAIVASQEAFLIDDPNQNKTLRLYLPLGHLASLSDILLATDVQMTWQ